MKKGNGCLDLPNQHSDPIMRKKLLHQNIDVGNIFCLGPVRPVGNIQLQLSTGPAARA